MADDIYRRDRAYKFVLLDHIIKMQLKSYNAARIVNAARLETPLTVQDVEDTSVYKRFGKEVPKTIPNSKTFWNSKLHELLALNEFKGREPDLFITLTSNDR